MTGENSQIIEDLVQKAKQGDRKAFSKVVQITMNQVIALTYRMTGDREAALDLAQDTFISAWENLKSFRGDAKFANWLYRIASNMTLNFLKKSLSRMVSLPDGEQSVQSELTSEADNPETILRHKQLRQEILDFMAQLPPQQRLVFELRFYKGLSFSEIAHLTGKAEGTVKTHYRQAVIKLRQEATSKGWR